ncbi:MAG: DASS family sodium-coupled anion symporter [Opitutaceae bacterium]|jgi:sodium-dependent dicarboxylate transporter 2/3/5|nr:DASS family sodium-coupled anion symporter [Opitutaceae bacterium]
MRRTLVLIAGLLLLALPSFLPLEGLSAAGAITLGIFLCAGLFWVFEPIPIYATSLLVIGAQLLFLSKSSPLVVARAFPFPTAEATSPDKFMATLAHPILILFLGGFMLAEAASKYSLEKSLTRLVVAPFGNQSGRVLFGLMFATALLSAFMSNTATTAMMITVISPIIATLPPGDRFRTALALAIPTAANLGGMATPIGTPPNALALGALSSAGYSVSFSSWMLLAAPLVVASLAIGWWLLMKLFPPSAPTLALKLDGGFDRSRPAILLYIVGGVTVALWLTEALHGVPSTLTAFIPIALLPALGVIGKKEIRSLSWEVLWLVGGGISLGNSLKDTGLATWMINLIEWQSLGPVAVLAGFVVVSITLANFLSHTVTTALLVPIAISLGTSGALGAGASMVFIAIAIALASSFGMSLPISTPPNAIAIATGLVTTPQMARVGVVMAVVGLVLTAAAALFFWPLLPL